MTAVPSLSGRPLLDYPQAAERLGIKEDHLRKLTYRRLIPFIKLPPGGRTAKVRFDPADLDTWINAHKVPALNLEDPSDAAGPGGYGADGNDRPKARPRLRQLLDAGATERPSPATRAG